MAEYNKNIDKLAKTTRFVSREDADDKKKLDTKQDPKQDPDYIPPIGEFEGAVLEATIDGVKKLFNSRPGKIALQTASDIRDLVTIVRGFFEKKRNSE